jgi:hypothetical protein
LGTKLKAFFILLVLMLIAGCATTDEKYSDQPADNQIGKAQLVIFRKTEFVGGGVCFSVKVDDVEIGSLSPGGYIKYWLDPGIHKITVGKSNQATTSWNAKDGERGFFQFTANLTNLSVMMVGNGSASSGTFGYSVFQVNKDDVLEMVSDMDEAKNHCLFRFPS